MFIIVSESKEFPPLNEIINEVLHKQLAARHWILLDPPPTLHSRLLLKQQSDKSANLAISGVEYRP